MRALILVAGAAMLAACSGNNEADNNVAVDNLVAENLVIENTTPVDTNIDANLADNTTIVANDVNVVDANATNNTM